MVIIHKERVSVPVTTMEPGTVFFNKSGRLYIVTDDHDDVEGMRIVVDIKDGTSWPCYADVIAIPCKITSVEVE